MNALTVSREQEIVTELSALNGKFQKASRTAVEAGVRMGELLTEIKASVGHGNFIPWVATHCEFSQRAANLYMAAFQAKFAATANLTGEETLVELAALGSKPQVKLARPVEEIKADIAKQQAAAPAPPLRPEPVPEAPRTNRPADMAADETVLEYAARKSAEHAKFFDEHFNEDNLRSTLINQQIERPKAFLLQELSELLDSKTGRKLIKQLLSSAYHPDTGKIEPDVQRMSRINEALTKLENC